MASRSCWHSIAPRSPCDALFRISDRPSGRSKRGGCQTGNLRWDFAWTPSINGINFLVLVSASWICFAPQAWPAEATKILAENSQRIEKMSQIERDHLKRNLTLFMKMNANQQQSLRELHQEVNGSGGRLSIVLQNYSAWLRTLTPHQREELTQETDSVKKLLLVKKIHAEWSNWNKTSQGLESTNDDSSTPFQMRQKNLKKFRSELAELMKIIATEAGRTPPINESQSDFVFYLYLVNFSAERSPGGPRNWPSPALTNQIVDQVKNQRLEKQFEQGTPGTRDWVASGIVELLRKLGRYEIDNETDVNPMKIEETQRQIRLLRMKLGVPPNTHPKHGQDRSSREQKTGVQVLP